MERVRFLALLLVLCTSSLGRAAPEAEPNNPDEEIARRHYRAGSDLYLAHDYERAIREFEAGRLVKPSPAFDYNIGRCHDLLEHWREAVENYERFLATLPPTAEAKLRARVVLLRQRAGMPSAEAAKPPPAPAEAARPPTPTPTPRPPSAPPELQAAPVGQPPSPEVAEPALSATAERTPPKKPLARRGWFWGVIVGAAVVVAGGVALGVLLSSGNHDPVASYGHVYGN
jgi:tetratricopeptide (TPR) repeat protein